MWEQEGRKFSLWVGSGESNWTGNTEGNYIGENILYKGSQSQRNRLYIDDFLFSSGKGCWCFLTNVMFRLLLSDSVFMFCYLPIVNTSNVQTPHFMYFISFYYYGHLNFISQTYFKNLWKMLSKKKKGPKITLALFSPDLIVSFGWLCTPQSSGVF